MTLARDSHRAIRSTLVLAAALAWPCRAAAQQPDEFALERFALAVDRDGIFGVESARIDEHMSWSAVLWLTLLDDPLVARRLSDGSETAALVGTRVASGLGGSLALWDRVELRLSVPVVVFQDSSGPVEQVGSPALPTAGLGDLRLAPKVQLVRAPVELALIPTFTVPLGPAEGWLRDAGPTFAPEVAVSRLAGPLHVALNVGYRLRKEVVAMDRTIDDELFARAGLAYRVGDRQAPAADVAFTVSATTPAAAAFSDPTENALEFLLGGSYAMGSWRVLLAGGFGVGAGLGNPDWRVVAATRLHGGRAHDADRDGVPDRSDRAPHVPEDRDGFADKDGVPDPDNDADGVNDGVDRCDLVAETRNDYQDDDGCPDELPAAVRVRAVTADGAAVPGAKVTVAWRGGTRELVVGEDGSAEALALGGPGEVRISVSAPGYQDAQKTATVSRALDPTTVEVALAPLPHGTIRGLIRSYSGEPVAASVRVEGVIDTQADEKGFFEFDLPPGEHQIQISAGGFASQKRTVRVADGGVTLLNVDLRKEGSR